MTAHFLTWIRAQADGAALQELAGWEPADLGRCGALKERVSDTAGFG
jgi:hypothetical protein